MRSPLIVLAVLALGMAAGPAGAGPDPFPELRPTTRAAAIAMLDGAIVRENRCLTPGIRSLQLQPASHTPPARRALELLSRGIAFAPESSALTPGGIVVRYTEQPNAFDHLDVTDLNADGRPDILQATLDGLAAADRLLGDRLGLRFPEAVEVVLAELGDGLDGYTLPAAGRGGATTIFLDATPESASAARRSAGHQYAHAVVQAIHPGLAPVWAEAFATWATSSFDSQLDRATATLFGRRLARLGEGLVTRDLELGAGNGIWFAFLDEAYGPSAVRFTLDELAGETASVAAALDRGIRRASSDDLASAFREFHLWTALVGDRATGYHFSFASQISPSGFASTAEGLPALSVQSDPAVSPLGAAQVRLVPDIREGGLRVHFEGQFPARWEVDLLLVKTDGVLHRHPLNLSGEGRGESTVPIDRLSEALLLVRNLDPDDAAAHRYTYAAHRERGFPFELTSIEALGSVDSNAVEVVWSTASERHLVGFNVLRSAADGVSTEAVNPVWIPALGDLTKSTSYRYLDRTALPDTAYTYRVEAITRDGLTSLSEAVEVVLPGATP